MEVEILNEFIKDIVSSNPELIDNLPEKVYNDKQFNLDLVKHKAANIYYINPEFRNDVGFINDAMNDSSGVIKCISDEIICSEEFILSIIKGVKYCYNITSTVVSLYHTTNSKHELLRTVKHSLPFSTIMKMVKINPGYLTYISDIPYALYKERYLSNMHYCHDNNFEFGVTVVKMDHVSPFKSHYYTLPIEFTNTSHVIFGNGIIKATDFIVRKE